MSSPVNHCMAVFVEGRVQLGDTRPVRGGHCIERRGQARWHTTSGKRLLFSKRPTATRTGLTGEPHRHLDHEIDDLVCRAESKGTKPGGEALDGARARRVIDAASKA